MIARWPAGPVCRSCYLRARANPAACSTCGQIRVLVAATVAGETRASVCGVCAASPHTYLCQRCGGGEEPYGRGHCVRCEALDRLTSAFAGADGQLTGDAFAIVDAFMAGRRAGPCWSGSPGQVVEPMFCADSYRTASGSPMTHSTGPTNGRCGRCAAR